MRGLPLIGAVGRAQLEQETRRVYEICDGCRRCFNLCPSFNTLLDRIDQVDSDVAKLTAADHHQIVDECYYCKLCYNHCPYTPPHQYAVDFPHLMAVWKRHLMKERGVRWRDRLLTQTDLIGVIGSRLAGLVNRALTQPMLRRWGERLLGLHRERRVLRFAPETFNRWFSRRGGAAVPPSAQRRVALFASCLVNYQVTDVGKAAIQVLEKNGVHVAVPDQQCCGMPAFDIGDTEAMVRAARANFRFLLPLVSQGYDVVVPMPSCSLMLKREYPELLPGAEAALVSGRTFDLCEYLMKLKKDGELATDFVKRPGRVAYQVPCHLRDQNIGFKSKDLMECAGAKVEVIERCSGHDGSWSAKVEFFPLSMTIAGKAVRAVQQAPADVVASDCPLAALQLDQAGAAAHVGGRGALHPIQIVRDAYGLPSE